MIWTKAEIETLKELWPNSLPDTICCALPRHTISAIRQQATALKVKKINRWQKWPRKERDADSTKRSEWTIGEQDRLMLLWPESTYEELKSAFPKRTIRGMRDMAHRLKVKRVESHSEAHRNNIDPIFHSLYLARRRQQLVSKTVAYEIGVHSGTLHNWECGQSHPSWPHFRKWLNALGFYISLEKGGMHKRIVEAQALPTHSIKPPTREQLMGRR